MRSAHTIPRGPFGLRVINLLFAPLRRGRAAGDVIVGGGVRRIRRMVDTVSTRMILIILLTSIPLAILSGGVSWHSYEAASDASGARAQGIVRTLRDRVQQDLDYAHDFLRNVASIPELRAPLACPRVLHLALITQRERYKALSVIDGSGRVVCSTSLVPGEPLPADLPAENAAGSGIHGVTLVRAHGAVGRMVAEQSWLNPAGPAHVLVAQALLGWSRKALFGVDLHAGMVGGQTPMHAWLIGPGGIAASACLDCAWPIPKDLAAMVRLARQGHGAAMTSDGGSVALGVLAGPISLLVVTQPTDKEVRALSVFIIRVIGIVLLLGVGLLGVAIGANLLVTAPLQALTGAVTQWRRAGAYDPGESSMMPAELRELSRAFHQATRSLATHERDLRDAGARQELLIKEIHHRVKNNLQIVASLLNLQANRIRQPEARAEFASARDRVRALATLHRYLYSEGELHTLNMRQFLHELCTQLFQAIGERQGRRIQLAIEAPEIAMSTDQAVPLALVVTEAVSNAVKYAFPGDRPGQVSVTLIALPAGRARLVIEDDGVGIPAGRAETETGVRDGLGIQLIRGFARQLGAELEVREGAGLEERAAVGTRYSLTFPLHPEVPRDDDTDDAPA
ncbi:sensor histidine kinase [Lichenicoccus sp.]|uniref:sensor histidine kinase n=1 Tax=Lichenicoccus sp. TaxID=2781899 RepID=UPI003D0D0C39